MGDMADWITEQGMEEEHMHAAGVCDDSCSLCLRELEAEAKATRRKKKPARRGEGETND